MPPIIKEKMTVEEQWEALMRSIREAAHKLNLDLTEADMPDYFNWGFARDMHRRLWAQLYAKRRR